MLDLVTTLDGDRVEVDVVGPGVCPDPGPEHLPAGVAWLGSAQKFREDDDVVTLSVGTTAYSLTRAAARQLAVDLAGAACDDDDKAAAVWAVVR